MQKYQHASADYLCSQLDISMLLGIPRDEKLVGLLPSHNEDKIYAAGVFISSLTVSRTLIRSFANGGIN